MYPATIQLKLNKKSSLSNFIFQTRNFKIKLQINRGKDVMKKVKPRNSSPIRIRGRGRSNNKPKGTMIFRLNHIIFFVPTLYNPRSTKGQLILKADWRAIDSAKKQTDEFVLFSFLLFTAKKSNSSIRFLGESTERQSAFRFYLTFMVCHVMGFSYGDSL